MKIELGEIRVSDGGVFPLIDESNVRIWHVDLESKYAEVLAYSAKEVLLSAGDRTLRINDTRRGKPTILTLDLPDHWVVLVDCSRYTCRIVGYDLT